ncbi:DTW domain-containing protein [Marinomonas agarivorans]|nr:DTW domain-containing protein [Marinomonas agarivorans]
MLKKSAFCCAFCIRFLKHILERVIHKMMITLLTHARELNKSTGTGKLVKAALGDRCNIITWSRTKPDKSLLLTLQNKTTLLLYPVNSDKQTHLLTELDWPQTQYNHFILLDSTWQEARKIYNRSPYLHTIPSYAFDVNYPSAYRLRRNQRNMGLCTAEVVLELLDRQKHVGDYNSLSELFQQHNH